MIIDPYNDGCNVWHGDIVFTIKGEPVHVCEQLYRRIVTPKETPSGRINYEQIYDLQVDIGGIGRIYSDILIDMGLSVKEIRGARVDDILPIKTDMINWHIKKEMNCEPITKFWK
jgi:hypothetical protein